MTKNNSIHNHNSQSQFTIHNQNNKSRTLVLLLYLYYYTTNAMRGKALVKKSAMCVDVASDVLHPKLSPLDAVL